MDEILTELNVGVIERFFIGLPEKALHLGVRILLAVVFLFVGIQIIKLIRGLAKKSLNKAHADLGLIQFLDSFIKVSLYVVLGFMVASNFGVDAAGIVALLGSAGVAIGLAIQGSLSNFAGGVLILLLKPFKVGDYIKEDASGHEGLVSEIQMFYTKLMTSDNRTIIVPNGKLANASMTNVSIKEDRRLEVRLGISYSEDIQKARQVILDVLKADASSLKDKEYSVVVEALGGGVQLLAACWVSRDGYETAKYRINEQLKYAFDEGGITIS